MGNVTKWKQVEQGLLRTKGYMAEKLEELQGRIGGVEKKVDTMSPRVEGEGLIFEEEEEGGNTDVE